MSNISLFLNRNSIFYGGRENILNPPVAVIVICFAPTMQYIVLYLLISEDELLKYFSRT